jgi:1,4-alpha-glucan branching enzyme
MRICNKAKKNKKAFALFKMIRFLTPMTAGEGYCTFMGTEFAHPDYIDFPRFFNNFSY